MKRIQTKQILYSYILVPDDFPIPKDGEDPVLPIMTEERSQELISHEEMGSEEPIIWAIDSVDEDGCYIETLWESED